MIHTLILGFDAFDPRVFERLHEQGRMPNLGRFVDRRGYSRFEVANPPQSEVSWTSIATGLNPGAHGMFDFVHRDPASYTPYVSLLPSQQRFGVTRFIRPHHATTIFDMAAERGYPATSLWWPATFPARLESPVRTLPGLGTPDLLGRLGVGTLYVSNPDLPEKLGKTPVFRLKVEGRGRYAQHLFGPVQQKRGSRHTLAVPFQLQVYDERSASLGVSAHVVPLTLGAWSPILELEFKVNRFVSLRAIARAILTEVSPTVKIYFLPIQLHPLGSVTPYGSPNSFVKRTWQSAGPFLSLGWPQDTTALEDGCINDDQFVALCESIHAARVRVLMHNLQDFKEGVVASVFDCLDRLQHMFWRDRPDIIDGWYVQLDHFVGDVMANSNVTSEGKGRLVILSDHGVERVDYKIHLNRWLIDNGYMMTANEATAGDLTGVKWDTTRAYAIGLNSLYLNLAGRERDGVVSADHRRDLCDDIRRRLLSWRTPDGNPVVREAWHNDEVYSGPLAQYGPDMIIGYSPGCRASSETGLGAWSSVPLETNQDHWSGDHCFDHRSVPGVLFANQGLAHLSQPSYRDIPILTVGAEPQARDLPPPPSVDEDDAEAIEQRLRSLGYL